MTVTPWPCGRHVPENYPRSTSSLTGVGRTEVGAG